MDEPLSNLDAKLRVQTRTQIASLQRRLGVTTVYVTHDQTEAMTMGDRVVVMKDGFLQQADTPQNLYKNPANAFVAGFIGSPAMNLVELPLTAEGANLGGAIVPLSREIIAAAAADNAKSVTLGFRPEDLHASDAGFDLNVNLVEMLGADSFVYGDVTDANGKAQQVTVRVDAQATPARGSIIRLAPRAENAFAFNAATGQRYYG
jgi:multiple sugar transport system ATP-binding protein